jgi:hypothetical protein
MLISKLRKEIKMKYLDNLEDYEKMFVLALILAVIAPNDKDSKDITKRAEIIAKEEIKNTFRVEKLKKIAEKRLSQDNPLRGLIKTY